MKNLDRIQLQRYLRHRVSILALISGLLALYSSPLLGCGIQFSPAKTLKAGELQQWTKFRRSNAYWLRRHPDRTYAFEAADIDPRDEDDRVYRDLKLARDAGLSPFDLLPMRDELFLPSLSKLDLDKAFDGQNCHDEVIYKLPHPKMQNLSAHLVLCKTTPKTIMTSREVPPVIHDASQQTVTSDQFRFKYTKHQQLLFDHFELFNQDGTTQAAAFNSFLRIKADLKNFFTLRFDDRDVQASMISEATGLNRFNALVAFYLKILFFKINLELYTSISFNKTSAHVPMTMFFPKNPREWVHPGSGALYGFFYDPNVTKFEQSSDGSISMLGKNPRVYSQAATNRVTSESCGPIDCFFFVNSSITGRPLSLQFVIRRDLVEKGFYPQRIDDLTLVDQGLDWGRSSLPTPANPQWKSLSFYFEVSQLDAGAHSWDFWLSRSFVEPGKKETESKRDGRCPVSIDKISRVSD